MNISECPEKYKQYEVSMSNGSKYVVDGDTKENIVNSTKNWVTLKNGTTINKVYIVEFKIDIAATREYVTDHVDEIKNALVLS